MARINALPASFYEQLGANIRSRRTELGLTMRQLANAVDGGTHGSSSISAYEHGKLYPSLQKIVAIADALDTTPAALLVFGDDAAKRSTDYHLGYRHGYTAAVDLLRENVPQMPNTQEAQAA